MAILPGSRIRDNGVFGTITDNPLTAGSTTFNSARLADLPVVAGNHAIITLDPLRQFGEPEIVMVTAHTASATVATVTRGMFGTTARSHPQNTLWVHAATQDDYTEVVTSGTRPTDQYRGQRIYESDTNRLVAYSSANIWQQEGLFFDPPACRVYSNVGQAIADSTEISAAFNTEVFDTNSMHDNAVNNNRITFNTAGIYVVSAGFGLGSRADYTSIYGAIRDNTATVLTYQTDEQTEQAQTPFINLTTIWKFSVGQWVELRVFQNNAANVASVILGANLPDCWMGAVWVGRGN